MDTVILNRTARLLAGHLWVFSNELEGSPKKYQPGSIVELRGKKNEFLGVGYVNPASLISVRVLSRKNEPIDAAFFKRRIEGALRYRKRFITDGPQSAFRAVYSEGDLLPGLIVDKYGDTVTVQFLTLGMEARSEMILGVIDEVFSPKTIVLKNDSSIRTLEGLALEKKIIKGSLDKLPVVSINGVSFEVDPLAGQKTGFFLDQAENRAAFARLIGPGRALDLFSYTGGWALQMAMREGVTVTGVDSSEAAVAQAQKNAHLNKAGGRCEFIRSDVFEFVKARTAEKSRYDYIALDPPAFVKSKTHVKEGAKAYREINASAMGLLAEGGIMATSSCSYHIDRNTFLDILCLAARDAGRTLRTVEVRSQAKDHPVLLTVPESEYLKCVILQAF